MSKNPVFGYLFGKKNPPIFTDRWIRSDLLATKKKIIYEKQYTNIHCILFNWFALRKDLTKFNTKRKGSHHCEPISIPLKTNLNEK